MSLQVWLPLNGNLNNNGIANVSVTNNGATVDNNGKIGKCYSFNGSSNKITNTLSHSVSSSVGTLACWVKFNSMPDDNSGTRWYSLMQVGTLGGFANCRLGLYMEYSKYINISIDGSSTSANAYTHSLVINQWYHLCTTYDGVLVKLYIDGNLVMTKTANTGTYNANATTLFIGGTSGYYLNGYMNDIRYYDHALSAKEVKEISKGLVLHYPLNGNGRSGDNLLSRYVSAGQNNPKNTSNGGRTKYYGDYGITIIGQENADTYFRLFLKEQLEQNTVYTISCKVSGLLPGSYYNFPLFAQSNSSMGILQLNHNGICSMTFTMTNVTQTAVTVDGETVYICFLDDAGRNIATGQGEITVTNFKIEQGNKITPWMPASTDPKYSELGYNSTTELDISGNNYNGIKMGSLNYNKDTARFGVSTVFNGTDNGILIENLPLSNIINTEVTYSFWIKPDGENGARSVYFGSYSGTSWSVEKTTGNILRLYWNGSPDEVCTGATIIDGIWQHVCISKKKQMILKFI